MIHSRLIESLSAMRLWFALSPCLALISCDKIKEVADGVSSKVGSKLEERLEEPPVEEPKGNPLMALVDQNEEGVVFRKDLDFPADLRVVTVYKKKINGRIFHQSELGRNVESVNGKESTTAEFDRKGGSVTYVIKDSSFELPPVKQAEGTEAPPQKVPNPFRQAPPLTKPLTFVRQGTGWKGKGGGDFKLMATSQQLSPVFEDMLEENALKARPLWFSSSRVKIGDELEISGGALPMLVSGKAKGSLKIKFEKIDEVGGHPCGLFSVSGEYSRSNFPSLEGILMDEEVSIESGEIWLSLIYPVILKEKLKTIQTFMPSDGGSSIGKGQGTVDTLLVREWHADIPLPEAQPEPVQSEIVPPGAPEANPPSESVADPLQPESGQDAAKPGA